MKTRQSISKLTAKHVLRTAGRRTITDNLGTGLIAALATTLMLYIIRSK